MLRNLKEFKPAEIEEKVLKFWKENQIFEKSVALRQAHGKKFRFFEGPPTANGRPGIHHIEARSFKDVIPRFKTMRGYFVRRKAGWDTHGLPVEIEIEKELGLKNKQEIEKFGIAEFNEKAKASVWKYQDEWEKLTDRIGFWVDMKDPYITYKPEYVESLWWIFKQIDKRGFLRQSFKIVPFCPRCQTPLSSHEMGQPGVYKKVKDPSVYVKFRILKPAFAKASGGKQAKTKEFLLVWTTTPWTLPSNIAIAVNPNISYTKYSVKNSSGKIEYLWSYNSPPVESSAELEVVEKVSGKKLIGMKYQPLFSAKGGSASGGKAPWLKNKKFFKVYGADFVGTEEGTGLVHIAPAFGEDDMNLVKKFQKELVGQIPITIDERGFVQEGLPGARKFAKQADKDIISYLDKKNLLFKQGEIEHEYPFCWRCSTPLLYYARFSWFVEMSRLRDELIKNNEKINWVPEHIKEGRFGEWLKEVRDWAISRDRYWGTPLPIWKCEKCDKIEVIGSLEDLDKKRFLKNRFFFLRHGEADHILTGVIASGPERGKHISKLTKNGVMQAERAAKRLKKERIDVIFSSPYFRTQQTAKIVSKITKSKIVTDERLSELNAGIFNWRLEKEYKNSFDNKSERFTKAPSSGESLDEVKKRMFQAIIDINGKYQNKNILIVGHGDPLWLLEGAMRGLKNEEILDLDYIKVDGDGREVSLHNWPYNANGELDLHRPYIDRIYLRCNKCKGRMERVTEVADCWFDSGAMPFAQDHYPFACAKQPTTDSLQLATLEKCIDFPADYISEAIDQTRGWFYTLLAIATVLGLEAPYKNVITLGLVQDKNGQKMSKSKGNVVNPWDMIQKYGSDIIRWYFYTINGPAEPKCFDEADLGKMLRKFIMIIYNSFVFWSTYTNERLRPESVFDLRPKNILDRWILAKLNYVILQTTECLDKYNVGGAAKAIEIFVDDLSRWYIRRSRSRFQKPEDSIIGKNDFEEASKTFYCCLMELSKLIAPFTPFFADALYLSLANNRKLSVHLEDWPKVDEKYIDYSLLERMEEVRRLSSLALAVRAEKGIKLRQPLSALEIKSKKLDAGDKELLEILKDEVNVKEIRWNMGLEEEAAFDTEITPELHEEGVMRGIARLVQGLRHDANYVPKDRISLFIEAPESLRVVLEKNSELLKKEVGAKILELKKSEKFDAELNAKIDEDPIWIGVRKI